MKFYILILSLLLIPLTTTVAKQRVYISVGQAKVKKSLMAITPIQYFGTSRKQSHLQAGHNLFKNIKNDMNVSSLFKIISPQAFLEDPSKVGLKPNTQVANGFKFKNWSAIGADFLIRAGYTIRGNTLKLETYLYYVPQMKLVFGRTYQSNINATTYLAHRYSNDIVKALTGRPGMFLSKIVAARKGNVRSNKEIYIMDWDGSNKRAISNHRSIALSPSWSSDGKKIAYTAFAYHKKNKTRNADLFVYEVKSRKRWMVAYNRGTNSGASFIPGKDQFVYYHSKDGRADIYRATTSGRVLQRLTKGPRGSANIEPAVSPDGKRVAFVSDRSGRPMIYVMNMNGTGAKRLTFAGKYNSSPSWSPDGRQIVFAGHDKGRFDIFTMSSTGENIKRLTTSKKSNGRWANNEDPSFSPDGRHILFSSNRTGKQQLYIIGSDGLNERRITFDNYNYTQPQWSKATY